MSRALSAPVEQPALFDCDVPFRWDVHSRSALGSFVPRDLALPDAIEPEPGYCDWVTQCCAQVMARSGGGDLYFVGRSPENLYDHLCGLLADTALAHVPHLLQFSTGRGMHSASGLARASLRRYFADLGLEPAALACGSRTVALVDLVCTGGTFHDLVAFLAVWAREMGVPWRLVRRRLRIIALVIDSEHSSAFYRSPDDWQERSPWVRRYLAPRAISNIALRSRLWFYLGNYQPKVTNSFTPLAWGTEAATRRPHPAAEAADALALAFGLYTYGQTRERRLLFAHLLARDPAMRYRWCRALVRDLRRGHPADRDERMRRAS